MRVTEQEVRSGFYETNRHLRKNKQHKISLPNFHCTVSYYREKRQTTSSSLPLNWLPNEALITLIQQKRIQWNPFLQCRFVPNGRFSIFSFQDFPFVVVDFDGITANDLKRLFEEKSFWFTSKYPYSLSPSLSGKGCHLHVWADFSQLPKDKYANDYIEGQNNWRDGARYGAYKEVQNWLIDEIEKCVGVVGDRNAVGSHLAYSPDEIEIINKFWADKSPVKLPVGNLAKFAVEQKKSSYRLYLEKTLSPFFEEMRDFLLDNPYEQVGSWCAENCDMAFTQRNKHYYYEAGVFLRNNFETIKEHILENWAKSSIFAVKTEDVGVGVADIQSRFFGLSNTEYLTYIRRFFLYMLCMTKTKNHMTGKYVSRFRYTEGSEKKSYFRSSFLEKFWFQPKKTAMLGNKQVIRQTIARELGNGQTFERLKYWTPLAVTAFGLMEALELLFDGIDLSCANDKNQRKREVRKFAHKIDRNPFSSLSSCCH